MDIQEFTDGLRGLGFTSGFALGNDPVEVILWENSEPIPSDAQIEAAIALGQYEREVFLINRQRHAAYIAPGGSDAVFMQFQRGLKTEQEWHDAVAAIDAQFPYPIKPKLK